MRTLNYLKNRRVQKYDYAFKTLIEQDGKDDEMFVEEVRQTFLNFLKPYLIDLPDYFNDVSNLNDQEIVFNKYFQKQEYLA